MAAMQGLTRPKLRNWGLYLAVWAGLSLLFASGAWLSRFYAGRPASFSYVLVASAAHYFVWGLLVVAAVPLIRRFPIERPNWMRRVPLHFLFGFMFVVLDVSITFALFPWIYPEQPLTGTTYKLLLAANFYYDLWMYWTVAGLVHAVNYYQALRQREVQAAQLEMQLAQAQLEVLKMQLHPHFLFNTLHAISTLMHKDVNAAERMLTRLSDLLRVSLETANTQEVSLKEELELLEHYVEIEKVRFQDRLTIQMHIEPEVLDATVPNLVLQPLVENALKHGIAKRAGSGFISLEATRENSMLRLIVRDDGPGLPRNGNMREGVGLRNTRARLKQLYGDNHVFKVANARQGGAEVTLLIPYREEEQEAGTLLEEAALERMEHMQ